VPCEIYAYSDASWADVMPQRKSSLSYLIFCNNAVFWLPGGDRSKKSLREDLSSRSRG
jgi:hypothetical protein